MTCMWRHDWLWFHNDEMTVTSSRIKFRLIAYGRTPWIVGVKLSKLDQIGSNWLGGGVFGWGVWGGCFGEQPISINFDQFRPISTNFNQFRPISTNYFTNFDQFRPTNFDQFRPVSTNFDHLTPAIQGSQTPLPQTSQNNLPKHPCLAHRLIVSPQHSPYVVV